MRYLLPILALTIVLLTACVSNRSVDQIYVRTDGTTTLNGQEVPPDMLAQRITREHVVIEADPAASYRDVTRVLEIVRQANQRVVNLRVMPSPRP